MTTTPDALKPNSESNYATEYFPQLQAILAALLKLSTDATVTNCPDGAIRWSATNKRFELYSGSTWGALCGLFDMNVLRLNGYQSSDFASAGHNHAGTYQLQNALLTLLAALTPAANKLAYFSASDGAALTDLTSLARTILARTTASQIRSDLGLVIGANVQAQSANLAALAGITGGAGKFPYFSGVGALDTLTIVSAIRTVLAAADVPAMRTAMGLGAAATLAPGTAAGNLVQLLTGSKLPAVDGSNLANVVAASIVGQGDLATMNEADLSIPTGEWEYVSKATPTGAAVSFTGLAPATYDYKIILRKVKLASNGYLSWQLGTGSTPTWVTSTYTGDDPADGSFGSLCPGMVTATTDEYTGEAKFTTVTNYVHCLGQGSHLCTTSGFLTAFKGSANTGNSTYTALRIGQNGAGGITGTIELWRRAKK